MNSKKKGARGERMLAGVLTDAGFPARRGQQFHGGNDSPDIICPALAGYHWEAKFTEQCRIRDWFAQAEADCAGKPWIIGWKRCHAPWVALARLDTLLRIIGAPPMPPNTLALLPAPSSAESITAPTPKQT